MPNPDKPLLLDTHAWFWMTEGDPRVQMLDSPDESPLVSVISVWEIALLVAKRRLRLRPNVDEWVRINLQPPVVLISLTPAIALLANALPGTFHGDPADRILMASALILGARLATADAKMLRYAKAHGVKTFALD